MSKLLCGLFAFVFGAAVFAQTVTISPPGPGQIPGTTTNNNANAGNVGEYIAANCPSNNTTATVTITIATPGVITWSGHPFSNTNGRADACPVVFTTTGALPTGITAGTVYYVVPSSITASTFQIGTTVANALAGTSVATTGTQSGTQTGTAGAALASNSPGDVTGISLTAGDWTVCAMITMVSSGGTSTTLIEGQVSTTSATRATAPNGGAYYFNQDAHAAGVTTTLPVGCMRQSLSATTTMFLVGFSQFTTTSNNAYGSIWARRVR